MFSVVKILMPGKKEGHGRQGVEENLRSHILVRLTWFTLSEGWHTDHYGADASRHPSCASTYRTYTGRHRHTGRMAHIYKNKHMYLQRHTGRLSKANTQTFDFKIKFIQDQSGSLLNSFITYYTTVYFGVSCIPMSATW